MIPKRLKTLGLVFAASLTLVASSCAGGDSPDNDGDLAVGDEGTSGDASSEVEGGPITFVTWGSDYLEAQEAAYVDPFTEETGIEVVADNPPDLAKLQAMIQADRVEWDVVVADHPWPVGENCGSEGLFQEIDQSNIDTSSFPEGTVLPCGIPLNTLATVMTYNSETYPDTPPSSLEDFFDPENFPGTRLVPSSPVEGLLEMALLSDGVEPSELYPLDYDRAFAQLDKIRDDLSYWESGAEQVEALESGRADMALAWNGRALQAVTNGAPYEPVWDRAQYQWVLLSIPNGSQHVEAATRFIEFATSPGPQGEFAERIGYGPANVEAEFEMEGPREEWEASTDEHREASWYRDQEDIEWWASNQAEIEDQLLSWISR